MNSLYKSEINQKIRDGFLGQNMYVMPNHIIIWIKKNPLISSLYITDIGYFPHATNHYRERKKGSSSYILIYCISGKGIIEMANRRFLLIPNTFFIIPSGASHCYYALDSDPWTIYWIHFRGSIADVFYKKLPRESRNNVCKIQIDNRRILLFENIYDMLEKGYNKDHIEYINIVLYHLLSSFVFPDSFTKIGKPEITNDLIQKAIDYVVEHIDENLEVNTIARKFNCSSSHFLELFKKKTGFSPIQYFNNLKIQRACQYLSFTNLSIKEICFSLGHNDPLYFSRLFKKFIGISPKMYRAQNCK